MHDIIQHMACNGIVPPSPLEANGTIQRFPMDSKDKKKSGWAIGFHSVTREGKTFYVFVYGNWRSQESFTAMSGVKLDKHDHARANEQIQRAKRKEELERRRLQDEAAAEANKTWHVLSDQFGQNAYLQKKQFDALYGSRICGDILLVPMLNIAGELRNVERIYGDGKLKKGLFGGQRKELFHQIGELGEIIYVAEGFSTAARAHDALGTGVVVAFNAGNLPPVAAVLSKKYPNKRIVVLADNDQYPNEHGEIDNVGIKKAEEAANLAGGKFVMPQFKDTGSMPTDFCDLYSLEGAETVRNQIMSVRPDEQVERLSVEYVVNQPYPDENPRTFARKGTMLNVSELLRRLRVRVRYNVISKEDEILIPGASFSLDNLANASLATIIDWCERVGISTSNLGTYLTGIGDANIYNPVKIWIESKPWDGKSRLDDLYATVTVKTEDTELNKKCMKEKLILCWMLSAIAAVSLPKGFAAQGVLVFLGPQGIGKTRWFDSLVPTELGLTISGVTLNPDDDDSMLESLTHWLVELGELDGSLNRSDSAKLKAFLGRSVDVIRRKYAKKASTYPRRTVFFGSVNEVSFLKDSTGNRRFWTLDCESLNAEHGLDMRQVWAEIAVKFKNGDRWYLTPEEIESLNIHNEQFKVVDSIEERIRAKFDWQIHPNDAKSGQLRWMSATEVCMALEIDHPTNAQARSAGTALRKLVKIEPITIKGTPRFRIVMPPSLDAEGKPLPY